MTKEEAERTREGLACCIECAKTKVCPKTCPYGDLGDETQGISISCEGLVMMDALRRIEELEAAKNA